MDVCPIEKLADFPVSHLSFQGCTVYGIPVSWTSGEAFLLFEEPELCGTEMYRS